MIIAIFCLFVSLSHSFRNYLLVESRIQNSSNKIGSSFFSKFITQPKRFDEKFFCRKNKFTTIHDKNYDVTKKKDSNQIDAIQICFDNKQ